MCRPCLPNELEMPLQQRNFEQAMRRVNENIRNNAQNVMGKTNYCCLVSGGSPGIGMAFVLFQMYGIYWSAYPCLKSHK
jgi:hypothetical protein